MPAALTFRGKLNASDFADMQWYSLAILFPKRMRFVTGLLLKVVAAACFYAMIEWGAGFALVWGFIISTALAVTMLFLPILVRAKADGVYRKYKTQFLETVVSLTDDGVSIQNEMTNRRLPWADVAMVADTPNGFMFRLRDPTLGFWLPQRVFAEDVTRDEVRMLLELMGVVVRHVS